MRGMPLRKALAVLREEKWLVLNLAVAGFLVALLALALVPRTYTTEAVFRVTGTSDTAAATDRYLGLLRGGAVADAASSLLAGVPPASTIREAVSGQAGDDGTVVVSIASSRAEDAPLLASAVGTAFMRLVEQTESVGRPVNRPASSVEQVGPWSEPAAGPWSRPDVVLPAGLVVGLVVGLLLATARSRRWGTVSGPDGLRRHTGLPVLSAVPSSEDPPPPPTGEEADADGADDPATTDPVTAREGRRRTAAADRLAQGLRRAPGGGATIVLVGAGPDQRTSTVALELGAALARVGERTVLVDADVRAGELAARTGLDTSPGWHDVIGAAGHPPERAVRRWEDGRLHVLPAGSPDGYADRVLADPRAGEALRTLAGAYDRVLVDTAGRAGAAGATDLARHADAAVLVVRRGTRIAEVEYALAALRLVRTRVLGAVLTDALEVLADDPRVAAPESARDAV